MDKTIVLRTDTVATHTHTYKDTGTRDTDTDADTGQQQKQILTHAVPLVSLSFRRFIVAVFDGGRAKASLGMHHPRLLPR